MEELLPWINFEYSIICVGRDGVVGWTVLWSNPGGGEIFRTRPDRPWDAPSLLYNGYRVSFPGVNTLLQHIGDVYIDITFGANDIHV
jgi:hypothetical protein